jgi:hypothetical protein
MCLSVTVAFAGVPLLAGATVFLAADAAGAGGADGFADAGAFFAGAAGLTAEAAFFGAAALAAGPAFFVAAAFAGGGAFLMAGLVFLAGGIPISLTRFFAAHPARIAWIRAIAVLRPVPTPEQIPQRRLVQVCRGFG